MTITKARIKKILFLAGWSLMALGTITLLVAAYNKNQAKRCAGVMIQIDGPDMLYFVDKADVMSLINKLSQQQVVGRQIRTFKLNSITKELLKNPWICSATVYFDMNDILNVKIVERQPIARIFARDGQTCYLDSGCYLIPFSNKHAAQVPVFTGFSGVLGKLKKSDSNFLQSIRSMSQFIQKDTFLYAMIDHILINNKNQFELYPAVGKQEILFGDTVQLAQKFKKLTLFYQKATAEVGWNRYGSIDLTYRDQIVAKIKDAQEVKADSLLSIQLMKTLATYSSKMAEDTTHMSQPDNTPNENDMSIILKSLEREYEQDDSLRNAQFLTLLNSKKADVVKKQAADEKKKDEPSKNKGKADAKPKKDKPKKNPINNQIIQKKKN